MEFNEDNKYSQDFFEQYQANYSSFDKEEPEDYIPHQPISHQRKKPKKSILPKIIAVILVLAIIGGVYYIVTRRDDEPVTDNSSSSENAEAVNQTEEKQEKIDYSFHADENTINLTTQLSSEYGILVELGENRIVAQKQCDTVMYPASMTKVLTLLVAVENLESLDETFQMTAEIVDPAYREGASMAGFVAGEIITAKDLLYGMVLPSGAEAAAGVAQLVGGTEEHFVELMNEKVAELGLTTAHFCNTSGLHDKDHYCTSKDMAIIMNAAIHNEVCKEILSTYQYTTQPTNKHPEGIPLTSTMFSRMTGEEPGTAKILAGKTGFINESGNCLVSYGVSETGKEYILVTAMAHGMWKSIFDHIHTYRDFTEKFTEEEKAGMSSSDILSEVTEVSNAGN